MTVSRGFSLVACALAVGCSASADRAAGSEAEANSARVAGELPPASADTATPAERPSPKGDTASCTAMPPSAGFKMYASYPATRPIGVGAGVEDGVPGKAAYAGGSLEQSFEGGAKGSVARPDVTNVASWLGAPRPNGESVPGVGDAHANFTSRSEVDPIRAWAQAQAPSRRRLTFSSAWSQKEAAWHFEDEVRGADAPSDPDARYVREFSAHRYLAFTLGVDLKSDCALQALADVLGQKPELVHDAAFRDATPSARLDGAVLDPNKRAAVEQILARDGAEVWVAILSNRARPSVTAVVEKHACNASNLTECDALVTDLQAAARGLEKTEASRHEDLSAGRGEWSVTEFFTGTIGALR
jgi:hypothetical protein